MGTQLQKELSINVFITLSVQRTISRQIWSFARTHSHSELFGTVTPPRRSTKLSAAAAAARRALTLGGGGVAEMAAAAARRRRRTGLLHENFTTDAVSVETRAELIKFCGSAIFEGFFNVAR